MRLAVCAIVWRFFSSSCAYTIHADIDELIVAMLFGNKFKLLYVNIEQSDHMKRQRTVPSINRVVFFFVKFTVAHSIQHHTNAHIRLKTNDTVLSTNTTKAITSFLPYHSAISTHILRIILEAQANKWDALTRSINTNTFQHCTLLLWTPKNRSFFFIYLYNTYMCVNRVWVSLHVFYLLWAGVYSRCTP